jgi:molecular chaperone DnaK (HSP70)
MLMQQGTGSEKPAYELVNVSSHSLGVVGTHRQTREQINAILIPKNSRLPCRAVRNFKTARADQRSVRVTVVEGESHRPEDCIALGECVVRELPPGLPQGTSIEVEYCYGSNGRLAISARVPSIRQSARVEIKRDQARHLDDLETWRKRLLGLDAAGGNEPASLAAAVDQQDRASILRRLDALYLKLGRAAANLALPPALVRSQKAALQAIAECTQTETQRRDAERARQAAVSRAETIRLDALLSQARTKLHEAQTRADFAHVVLGRECAAAGFCPPAAERDIQEIRQLQ